MRNTGQHPEGLTVKQEDLANLLFSTKTVAPVRRRTKNSDESFTFKKIQRPTSPVDFAIPESGEFALKVHETQPDAPLSPVYINLRKLPDRLVYGIGLVLAEMTEGDESIPDFCTGIPKTGITLANAYSEHSDIPYIDIFTKIDTPDGKGKLVAINNVDGIGKTIRLVDDLATHGKTKIEAVEIAQSMGFRVADVSVLVDRQQGANEELAEVGIKFRAAFEQNQLFSYGLRNGTISQKQYQKIQDYLANSS